MRQRIIKKVAFVLGLCLCSYPLVSNVIARCEQRDAITTYQNEIKSTDGIEITTAIKEAIAYNDMLYQAQNALLHEEQTEFLSEETYLAKLNLVENGVMGSIEIPKINVNLPIYHGTEEAVLSVGAGHVYSSSLPVGGDNTHSILTGHRGLPNSKLFTRLDEIKEGDIFLVKVYRQTLAYEVCEIQVIKPEDTKILDIQSGKDLVSLITCTPYGINTHRLVVTGERIPYEEAEIVLEDVAPQWMSLREMLFASLPFLFVIIAIVKFIRNRKESRCEKTK